MLKYVFRRMALGVVLTPLIAVAWVVFYALLVAYGAEPTGTVADVFGTGMILGGAVSVWILFQPYGTPSE